MCAFDLSVALVLCLCVCCFCLLLCAVVSACVMFVVSLCCVVFGYVFFCFVIRVVLSLCKWHRSICCVVSRMFD